MERRRKRLASRGYVGGGMGWMYGYGVRDDDDRDDLTMTGFGGHLGEQFDGVGEGDGGDGGGDGGGGE
jgi:hypothetical protein